MDRHLFYIAYELDMEPFKSELSEAVININTKNGVKRLNRFDYVIYESESLKLGISDYEKIEKSVCERLTSEYGIDSSYFGYSGIKIHCIFCIDTCINLLLGNECSFVVRYAYTIGCSFIDYGKYLYIHKKTYSAVNLKTQGEIFGNEETIQMAKFRIIDMLEKIHKEIKEDVLLKADTFTVLFMYELDES